MSLETTWRKIIRDAVVELGVRSIDESLQESEENLIFDRLRQMLDQWSNDSLLVWETVRDTFNGNNTNYDFTIGPGGDVNVAGRPLYISSVAVQHDSLLFHDLVQRTSSEITDLRYIRVQTPVAFAYEQGFPLGKIRFNSIPFNDDSFVITSKKGFALPDNVADNVHLPDGYTHAIINNLAMEISPLYGVDRLNVLTIDKARKGMIKLKNQNSQPIDGRLPRALQGNINRGNRRSSIRSLDY